MKKYFITTLFLLFIASTFSIAQEDNSDLMKSQKQVEKQQKELKRQQNRVEKKHLKSKKVR